jgi:hypothetical protein
MHHYPRFAYLWFGARINQRIAAPTKNKAPMTRLSPGLAISVRKNSALMKPGQDQQTAPATAKTMASALIIVATPCPQRPITQPRAARRTYDGADLPKGGCSILEHDVVQKSSAVARDPERCRGDVNRPRCAPLGGAPRPEVFSGQVWRANGGAPYLAGPLTKAML